MLKKLDIKFLHYTTIATVLQWNLEQMSCKQILCARELVNNVTVWFALVVNLGDNSLFFLAVWFVLLFDVFVSWYNVGFYCFFIGLFYPFFTRLIVHEYSRFLLYCDLFFLV